jgi:hypothetical protein
LRNKGLYGEKKNEKKKERKKEKKSARSPYHVGHYLMKWYDSRFRIFPNSDFFYFFSQDFS